MKSLMELLQCVLIDLGTRCGTNTALDWKTIQSRSEHEGVMSFLGITLAKFGKDFEKSLDQGFVGHDQFAGWSRTGGLPRFLGGFLDLVFDRKCGRLLDEPSVDAIYAVRQITLMWAKIEAETSERRTKHAYKAYAECEREVRRADQAFYPDSSSRRDFSRLGRLLWADLFTKVDHAIYQGDILPKHGPGATADRLSGNGKWMVQQWTERLESVFPHWEYLIPSARFIDRTDSVTLSEPGTEIPVKVITVPKTVDKPRIIAIEPTCMQFMQQGVHSLIRNEMRANDNARHLVLYDSQVPNQYLARKGSIDGSLATLDLSEASDRVSNEHVRELVKHHPWLARALDATRSRKARVLLDGEYKTLRLAKFASMGSALCFPMEALVFTTVVFMGIEKALNRRMTTADVRRLWGQVRVYGDDIIVPVVYVQAVCEELENFGFRVNRNKSFWTGKFRESCGEDYYDGRSITIVRCRRLLPKHRADVAQVVSAVSLRNQLFHAGFTKAVEFLDDQVQRIIPFPEVRHEVEEVRLPKGSLPAGNADFSQVVTRTIVQRSPVLGRHTWGPCQGTHYDTALQRPLVKGAVVQSKSPISRLDDYGALQKWFTMRGFEPLEEDHLLRAGRPDTAHIKIRLAPV